MNNDAILGSIIYLDEQEVDNLLDSIEGGLVNEFKQTQLESATHEGSGSANVYLFDGKYGRETAQSNTVESVRRVTPISRLVLLRRYLIESDYLEYINVTDEKQRSTLVNGQLVEVHGQLSISRFWDAVDKSSQMMATIDKFGNLLGSQSFDETTRQTIEYFQYITNRGIAIHVTPEKLQNAKKGFDFACILDPEQIRVDKTKLRGTVNVLARIEQIPKQQDIIYLYELIPGFGAMPNLKDFVENVKDNPLFHFSERDIRLQSPSILLTPIAIYS